MPTAKLKEQWQALFDTPPPPYNRRFLESRLAYRIQELAYGGLKPETIRRLEILGEQYDSGNVTTHRIRHDARPFVGALLGQVPGQVVGRLHLVTGEEHMPEAVGAQRALEERAVEEAFSQRPRSPGSGSPPERNE